MMNQHFAIIAILFSALLTGDSTMAEQNVDTSGMTVVKLTYLGEQDKPVASLLISSTTVAEPMDLFTKIDLVHSNDKYGVINLIVEQARLDKIVALTGTFVGTDNATGQVIISASIINISEGSYSGSLLGSAEARKYLDALHQELADCEDTAAQFDAWWARTNLTKAVGR